MSLCRVCVVAAPLCSLLGREHRSSPTQPRSPRRTCAWTDQSCFHDRICSLGGGPLDYSSTS